MFKIIHHPDAAFVFFSRLVLMKELMTTLLNVKPSRFEYLDWNKRCFYVLYLNIQITQSTSFAEKSPS